MPTKKSNRARLPGVPRIPGADSFPGQTSGRGLLESQWTACREMLRGVYGAREGNRYLAPIFCQLPDREEYADYYEAIPEPECLDNVAERLSLQTFSTAEECFKQLHLVFLNAKHYNEEGSQIWEDAKRLEDQIHDQWRAKAAEGIFGHQDPYHFSPRKPSRKSKREKDTSDNTRESATPAPSVVPATTTSHVKPTKSVGESTTPTPAPAPAAAPAPEHRENVSIALPVTKSIGPLIRGEGSSSSVAEVQRVPSTIPVAERRMIADMEAKLPKWEGPREVLAGEKEIAGISGSGWLGEGFAQGSSRSIAPPDRIKAIMHAVASYQDSSRRRLAEVLEQVPTLVDIPGLSFAAPISFSSIHMNARSSRYRTLRDFDLDMTRFFEKARRWSQSQPTIYGAVLILQRLYNALTAPLPLQLPASGIPEPSATGFASLPAGPGNARFAHEQAQEVKPGDEASGRHITSFRIGTKDRIFTSEARYKGLAYKVGDYVHLMNPDDPSRPIVGQIFKTFVPSRGVRAHYVTVCWYFRPEETVHPAEKQFFENEIFKTGHFCDHPVEDIIERVSVAFYVKYVRGRPRAPEYYPGWPLYVCHSRYNDQKYQMVRIKNWASCIPDELRQTDFMSIVPFPQQLEPQRIASPFLRGIPGPGFLGEPKEAAGEDDEEDEEAEPRRIARLPARESVSAGPTSVELESAVRGSKSSSSTVQNAAPVLQGTAAYASLMYKPRPPNTSLPAYKSIISALGGPQITDHVATRETLPIETSELFDRDARGQALWFSGPPLPLGAVRLPESPSHSLEYLDYLCKRKQASTSAAAKQPAKKMTRHQDQPPASGHVVSLQTAMPTNSDLHWWSVGQTHEQIAASLKSLIDSS